MKFQGAVLASLATSAAAFPSMMGSREQLEELLKRSPEPVAKPEPQLLGGIVGSLTNTISGLLGAIAQNVNPEDARPEKGFEFKAPGPSDSRGPCPGLNLLANHGYLPRDGHVTLGQVIEATARGFNMAPDISTILGVFSVLTDGDIATESFYLGAGPGNIGGLNRHSTVEVGKLTMFHRPPKLIRGYRPTSPSTARISTTAAVTTTTYHPACSNRTSRLLLEAQASSST